jgi:two-component system, chemotaxis family, chemotaxis protein CheY
MGTYKGPVRKQRYMINQKLLVVDDQPRMREMIHAMLRSNGFDSLIFAESGKQALRSLVKQEIKLVITDWNMPNMTGIELLKQIKGDPKLFSIPVMMVSDERAADKVLYAVEEGTDGFLVKPFSENDLIKNVNRVLAKSSTYDEMEQKIFEMRRLKLSKKYREALDLGLEILKDSNNQRVALLTCECLYQIEEYDKAISMMADTDEENRSSQHTNLLGKIHLGLGQYSQGILALEQASRMNPLNYERKLDLASAYFTTGRGEDAEKIIKSIENSRPTDLELVNIAQIYLDQDNLDKAGEYLRQTVDPIKESIHVFNNYAVALRRADRMEDATGIYLKCLKIDPESDVLHYNLAVLYAKSNKLKEAKEAAADALKLNPENQHARDLLQKISQN